MNPLLLITALQITPAALPPDEGEIVVTASLNPVPAEDAPASVSVFDEETIDALGLTMASDFARLAPGVSVSTTGALGTETVVRIRGGESQHTLLFVDGIVFNDIAAANAARFDTLTASELARIELVRGPQSALWGSEALGGVVAMSSPDPLGRRRAEATAEFGGRDSWRAGAALVSGGERFGLSATASWTRSDGIDVLGGGNGDRDGFENLTIGARALARLGAFELGAAGRYIHHDIAFDGVDPLTFQRADTADVSVAEIQALRGWVGFGSEPDAGWSGRVEFQHLDSENRNRLGTLRTSDSFGRRTRFGGRVTRRIEAGGSNHALTFAIEREEEKFGTRDLQFGTPDRELSRARTAFVGEWRAVWSQALTTDVALRHDYFNRFVDATTLRAHAVLEVGGGFALLAGYGEGIAQPSFIDLFGFPGFPFVGNPDLRPERSSGYEAGLRWRGHGVALEAVAFSNDLEDEIVEDFNVFPSTVINAVDSSRRRGLELSGEWRPRPGLTLGANYTHLDAREAGSREIRRPRHNANAFADWRVGALQLGASLAYVGRRTDRNFDLFPAPAVLLDDYLLASLRIAYRILPQVEIFARTENGFDADYQDVFGYNTPGRAIHAGLRVDLGD